MKKIKIYIFLILISCLFVHNVQAQINTDTISLNKSFWGKRYYYQDKLLRPKKFKELANSFEVSKKFYIKAKQNMWLSYGSCLAALISHITYQRLDRIYPYRHPFYSTTKNGKLQLTFTFALFVPAYYTTFKSMYYSKKTIKAYNKAKLQTH
jgi:hypothetical protein